MPAATNLVTNGGFETNTTGWAKLGANTIARVNNDSEGIARMYGEHCLKVTYQDNATFAFFGITLTATDYAAGVSIYIPTAWDAPNIGFTLANFTGSTGTVSSADMGLLDQWQRVTHTRLIAAGDLAGNLILQQFTSPPTAGRFFYIDGAQVEIGQVATPYIETNGAEDSRPRTRWVV
jgi:hypothetical protein